MNQHQFVTKKTPPTPYTHHRTDIAGGADVASGATVVPYTGPHPFRGTGHHRYVFVLLEQAGAQPLAADAAAAVAAPGRTLNLDKAATKLKLNPVGLAFFQARRRLFLFLFYFIV